MSKKIVKRNKRLQEQYNIEEQYKQLLFDHWKEIATSIFVWEGFSSGFISDEIERKLFDNGSVVFFVDEDGVQKVLPWALIGGLNIYGLPVKWQVYGVGSAYRKNLNDDNSVMIWNTKLRKPTKPYVITQLNKYVNADMAIDVNVNAIKTPYVFQGTKEQLLTFKNMYQQISSNEPVIYINNTMSLDKELTVHDLKVDYRGKDLIELTNDYEGRILKYLGLKYVDNDKKERLVVDEANAFTEIKNINLAKFYDQRKEACNLINKMYGLNVSVKLNPVLIEEQPKKEVKPNE